MANKDRSMQRFTVQESTNILLPRLIKVSPTIVADDNADDDVAFNWTKIENASTLEGHPTKLKSVVMLDPTVGLADIDLIFCRGAGADGTAPTTAQNLQDGADGSAAVDITAAEAVAINICGSCKLVTSSTNANTHESNLLTCQVLSRSDINLIMAPASNSRDLYVGGIWRQEPADQSGGLTYIDLYLGFEG